MVSIDVCIKCGAKKGGKAFVDLLCIDCYVPKIKFPSSFQMAICPRCGAVLRGKRWDKANESLVRKDFAHKARGRDANDVQVDINKSMLTYFVETDRGFIPMGVPIRVEIKKELCDFCRKRAGGYFEAIIQLRGNPRMIEKWRKILERKLDERTFVASEEELKEGIDMKVGSSKAALSAINELGLRDYKISRKLFGLKEGKRVYRTSFAIRFE
jgi:nonsense-mediated mRNA decay protein 3